MISMCGDLAAAADDEMASLKMFIVESRTVTALSTTVQAVMVAFRSPVWPTMSPLGKFSRTCTQSMLCSDAGTCCNWTARAEMLLQQIAFMSPVSARCQRHMPLDDIMLSGRQRVHLMVLTTLQRLNSCLSDLFGLHLRLLIEGNACV